MTQRVYNKGVGKEGGSREGDTNQINISFSNWLVLTFHQPHTVKTG